MAIVRAAEKHYLDLENAVEVEDKLTRALNAVAAHSDRLKEKKEGGEELTLEDTYHLESLMKKLKMIEKRQAALQEVVDADVKKKEENNKVAEELKVGRRKEAMEMGKEKNPRPVTMQELRDMNQIELTSDDKDKRYKDANVPNRITPSGGLIGFRIAEDLLTKEYKEDKEKPEILLGGNHNE